MMCFFPPPDQEGLSKSLLREFKLYLSNQVQIFSVCLSAIKMYFHQHPDILPIPPWMSADNQSSCVCVRAFLCDYFLKWVVCAQFISIQAYGGHLSATLTSHQRPNLWKQRGALFHHNTLVVQQPQQFRTRAEPEVVEMDDYGSRFRFEVGGHVPACHYLKKNVLDYFVIKIILHCQNILYIYTTIY